MSSAQVILVNDVPYVVDCANAVARQLVSAGVALAKIRHVFVTHHHSDPNADYGTCSSSRGSFSTNATTIRKHIIDSHTPVEQVGEVAAAGVKTLVLSHLVPADDERLTEQTWIDLARAHFKGQIIVGRDLMEL